MKRLVHVLPRGEAVLPLLLIALLVLMFVAWPLAEIGVIERPLVGMLLVIVFLCALLTLGGSGRFAVPTIVLGLLLFVCLILITLLHDHIIRPLQTLSNVVSALREEDYSFRARGAWSPSR